MTKCLHALRATLVAGGLALLPGTALAQDAADFAAKFAAAYAYSGYELSFGTGTAADGTITYDGVTVALGGMGELLGSLAIPGPVVVEGVAAKADGGYTATRMVLPDFAMEMEGFGFSVEDLVLEGIDLPAGPDISATEAMRLITGGGTGPITITIEDAPPLTIAATRADIAVTDGADGPVFDTVSSLTGIAMDLSGIEGLELEAGLAILGKTELTGRIDQKASWSLATGRMDIPETAITIDGIGKFNLSLELLGYTAAVLDRIAETQRTLAGVTDPEARAAEELAIGEEMLSAISLGHIALRFEELGLIDALLGFSAEAQGVSKEEAVDSLVLQLPVLLGSSGTVGDAARLAEAADAFLRDPRSLELRVAFDPPFSFALLAAEETPETAPEGMTVTLSANGLNPVPIDLETLPVDEMLDMMMEDGGLEEQLLEDDEAGEETDQAPRSLPRPGADPRG
ncbi:hypothetical protein SAMN02983003_3572 [Devosia enhydra]|uniref:Uncharacterized protein n=1 Tax=Devosia enhydra TaxID=665118 RepID=A0A1K2I236_9HYPH|nr:hypothetical protein [Devosia enhydra]SFZ86392.1 hypothetical protein SAMN02983003_3572 [Devosia enhydra]